MACPTSILDINPPTVKELNSLHFMHRLAARITFGVFFSKHMFEKDRCV